MPSHLKTPGADRLGRLQFAHTATIAFIGVLCFIVVGHDLFRTWQDRSRRLAEAHREVGNLAWAADQQAEDAFRLAGARLTDIAERVQIDGTGPAQIERLRRVMVETVASLPVLQSIDIIDDTGVFVVDSRETTMKVNVGNRDYFLHHKMHADHKPYLSRVFNSLVTGKTIVVISQRIDHLDGSFAGVVAAAIDVSLFQNFYAAFDLGRDGVAALFRDDGTVLVRQPMVESLVGAQVRSGPPFAEPRPVETSGEIEGASPLDGTTRIYAWRRVTGYPLVVGVALGKDEQLAEWRVGAGEHLLAAAASALLLGFVGVRLVGRVRLLTQAERKTAAAVAVAETAAAEYRLLADNASDMIVAIDLDFNRRYVSPGCRELLGYEPEELTGRSPLASVHPDDAGLLAGTLREMAAGRDRARISCRVTHRDGRWLWVDVSFRLIRDPDTGTPLEIQSALRDVSERMTALAALQHSEARFRLLLQSDAVTEAIYMLDPEGNIETWNAAAERIKGYTAGEIIGRNFAVFFTPEDIAGGEPARWLARGLESGTAMSEAWRMRKDGSRFLAHVIISASRDRDGRLRGFVKSTRDITERRIEEEQRAIIVEAAPNGMLIVDEAGIITLANSQVEHIFGYPDGTLIQQPLEILVPEGFRTTHEALRLAFTSGVSERAMTSQRQFTGRKRDGTTVVIEIMLRPVRTPRGRIVIASLFDVTDRIREAAEREEAELRARLATAETNANLERLARHLAKARDRSEQANRAKSRFLAGMSHELRTPLNGILGYAHMLHIEGGLNPTQTVRVDAMLEAGKHLLEMITCVLDLSEIEAEQVVLHPVEVDLGAIAAACLDLVRPMAEAKGLALGLAMAADVPPKLVADATRLRQIMLNLLGNAAKFTREGAIELRFRRVTDGSTLRIEVADTGPGIAEDQRERLFQDFERLDTAATRMVEGAGLGLALSARLAGLMGGSLGQEANPGGGSVFWLQLPFDIVVGPGPSDGVGAVPGSTAAPRKFVVLVVDDVRMNRDIASSFLQTAGHTIVCVEGGAEAVEAVAGSDFDVVLMDIRMPGMDGLEATRRIRLLSGARGQVPIVALTAQAFTEQVAACRAAGMDSHLSKPFDPETLLAAVAQAVAAGRVALPVAPAVVAILQTATPLAPVVGSELAVVDRAAFERTAAFLPAAKIGTYLGNVMDLCGDLLQRLGPADAVARTGPALAEAAHTLAGSAGMLGFTRVASMGRRFEQAVISGSDDVPALAAGLIAALTATRQAIPGMRPEADQPQPHDATVIV